MINNKFFKKKIKNQNKIILYCENDNITYETLEMINDKLGMFANKLFRF